MDVRPTEQAYPELQTAYDWFNTRLFGGLLPACLITFQRKNRMFGAFAGSRWATNAGALTDEIALNPQHFATRSLAEVLSTLAHEMVHLWQHHHGAQRSRAGYHNAEWATQMQAIGLMPSATGAPGGHTTGQHMTHYVLEDGPYALACADLLATGLTISWHDRATEVPSTPTPGKAGVRMKYTCPSCALNAWAKADVALICGACEVPMVAEGTSTAEPTPEPTPEPPAVPPFDPHLYRLGSLCKRGHDYHGTGSSLRRLVGSICVACARESQRKRP